MTAIVQSLLQVFRGVASNGSAGGTIAPSAPMMEHPITPPRDQRPRSSVSPAITSYDHVFDNVNDAIFIHDLAGHLLQVNQIACERLGYARAELLQMRVQQLDTPERAAYFEQAVRIIEREGSMLLESCHRRKDGTCIPVEINARRIQYRDQPAILSVARDIGERKRAEKALRQAEEKYRHIFENAIEGIFQSTRDGRYLSVNPAMASLHGYSSPEEMIRSVGDEIERRIHVDPQRRADFKRILEEQDVVRDFEAAKYRKDGSQIWTRTNARAVRDSQGVLLYYEGFVEDITEDNRALRALQDSEMRYRMLMEQAPDGIALLDAQGKIVNVNSIACKMLGYAREELLSMTVADILAPGELGRSPVRFDLLREGKMVAAEWVMRRKDVTLFPAEVNTRMLPDGTFQGILRDTSDRKQLEEEIQRRNRELETLYAQVQGMLVAQRRWNADLEEKVQAKTSELRALAETRDRLLRQMMTAQEEERRRVARELHDETSQALTALIANVGTLRRQPPSQIQQNLDEIRSSVVDILRGINRIVLDLRPTLLDDYGLLPALSWYAEKRLGSDGIRVETSAWASEMRLPPTVETVLFRIGQEAITNAARHAKASRVRINLHCNESRDRVTLDIEDDGVGFDEDQIQRDPLNDRARLGLLGMQERVQLIGGELLVRSEPGQGTLISVTVPLGQPAVED